MYHKKYKTDKGRKFGVQRTRSDAHHWWYEYMEFFGWCATLSHKKPRGTRPVMLKFKGRVGKKPPYVGVDTDRNWLGNRFIVDGKLTSKRSEFFKRIGWRLDVYGK